VTSLSIAAAALAHRSVPNLDAGEGEVGAEILGASQTTRPNKDRGSTSRATGDSLAGPEAGRHDEDGEEEKNVD
jgi:hypothetical protein